MDTIGEKRFKENRCYTMVGLTTNVMAQIGKNKPITFRDLGEYAKYLIVHLMMYSLLIMNM